MANAVVFTEEVAIEYVEFVPDQRMVFEAQPKMTIAGLGRLGISVSIHTWTWTFAPEDGGTRLTLVVVEQDPPLWQRAFDVVTERTFSQEIRNRLARIKAGAEEQAALAR